MCWRKHHFLGKGSHFSACHWHRASGTHRSFWFFQAVFRSWCWCISGDEADAVQPAGDRNADSPTTGRETLHQYRITVFYYRVLSPCNITMCSQPCAFTVCYYRMLRMLLPDLNHWHSCPIRCIPFPFRVQRANNVRTCLNAFQKATQLEDTNTLHTAAFLFYFSVLEDRTGIPFFVFILVCSCSVFCSCPLSLHAFLSCAAVIWSAAKACDCWPLYRVVFLRSPGPP